MAIDILRDEAVEIRVVFAADVGHALIGEDEGLSRWAVYTLVHELAQVAMVHHIDTALPGHLLKPMDGSLTHAGLYACVHPALEAYYAARESAPFAPSDETREAYDQLAAEAFGRAERIVIDARRSYRYHVDLDEFIRILMRATQQILEALAKVFGHRDGRDEPPADLPEPLKQALSRHFLSSWIELFRSDLASFADRAGRWQSFDEFTRFIQHAERIWWAFGAFPWRNEAGQERVEVPIAIEAQWLHSNQAHDQ